MLLWMGRHSSDKNELWPTRHPVPVPVCFSNPNPGSSWGPAKPVSLWPPWAHKAARPRMQCTLTPLVMSLPASVSTSVESAHVKWGAGCLMVVSCMPLGVKITKAGSFSSPPICGTPLESYLLLVITVTEAGSAYEWGGRVKRDH